MWSLKRCKRWSGLLTKARGALRRCAAGSGADDETVEFVRSPVDVTVTEGEDASFECELRGSPATTTRSSSVSWYKDDDLIPADDDDFRQSFDGRVAQLYIAGTYVDDAGVYTCTATSSDRQRAASIAATLVVNGRLTLHAPSAPTT